MMPLTPFQFRARLDPLLAPLGPQGKGPLAVAVSGGGDSMALLRLVHESYPGRPHALTVDHGLRVASADEARQVGAWCESLGVPHRVLRWTGQRPATGIQAAARAARYRLLANAAIELGVPLARCSLPLPEGRGDRQVRSPCLGERADTQALAAPLLVAHTLEDQAETFLLRLGHGSGLGGLAAMRPSAEIASVPPVPLLRPLLGISRTHLRQTLNKLGQPWIEDPSNENPAFERVRLRRALPALGAGGLDAALLARTSRLMARIDDLLLAHGRSGAPCRWLPEGAALLDADEFGDLPAPIARRWLSRLLRIVGGDAYPPRGEALEALAVKLARPDAKGATLAGCRLIRIDAASWCAVRELRGARRAAPALISGGGAILWDNRFWVRLPLGWRETFTVQPLGAAPEGKLASGNGHAGGRVDEQVPRRVVRLIRETLPGLWRGSRLVAAPEIAPDWRSWSGVCERPVALCVGQERVDGGLCALWRQAIDFGAQERSREVPRVS